MIAWFALHAVAALVYLRARANPREPGRQIARIGALLWGAFALGVGFSLTIPAIGSLLPTAPGVVDRAGWIAAAVQAARAGLFAAAVATWLAMVRPDIGGPKRFLFFVAALLALEGPGPVALFALAAVVLFMRRFRWYEALRGSRRSRILLGALIGIIPLFPGSTDHSFVGPSGGDGMRIRVSASRIRFHPIAAPAPGVSLATRDDNEESDAALPEPYPAVASRLLRWNRACRAGYLVLGVQGALLLFSFLPPLLRLHGVGLKRRFAVMMALVRSVPALLALLLLGAVIYFAVGVHRVSRATDLLEATLERAATGAEALSRAAADSTAPARADLSPWREPGVPGALVVLRRGPELLAASGGASAAVVAATPFGPPQAGTRRGLAAIAGGLFLVAESAHPGAGESHTVATVFVPLDSTYLAELAREVRCDVRFETIPSRVIHRSTGGLSITDSSWAERPIVAEGSWKRARVPREYVAGAGGLSIRIAEDDSTETGESVDAAAAPPRSRLYSRPLYLGRRTLPVGAWSANEDQGGACRMTLAASLESIVGSLPDLAILIGEFNLGLPVLVVVLLAMGVLQPISVGVGRGILKGILEDVGNLTTAARKLGEGDFDHVVPVRGNDELGGLAGSFNAMAANLKRQREELKEKERMAADLAVARDIQRRLLPQEPPQVAGLDVAGASIPTHEVGGDLFHFITLPGGRLALALGDVAGKGVSAALLMSNALAGLRAHVQDEAGVGDCMTNMNRHLNDQVEPGRFVTFFYGVLDPAAGEIRYGSAGHNPSLVVGSGGASRWLSEGGPPFGLGIDMPYAETTAPLQKGDVLVLYSDGVTEAIGARGPAAPGGGERTLVETGEESFYGEARLEAAVKELRGRSSREILDGIIESVRAFAAGEPQADDMTLVVVKLA